MHIDHERAYWTGYYTSHPVLKQYIRASANVVRIAELLFTFAQAHGYNINVTAAAAQLEVMREALGVAQHHDAISGTEQEFVVTDYKYAWQ